MEQVILWLNIVSFAVLLVSMGAAYLVFGRQKPDWLYSYLLYLGVYAVFTIINTYAFFSQYYLPSSNLLSSPLSSYFSFFIALLLLLVVPRFLGRLLFKTPAPGWRMMSWGMAGFFCLLFSLFLWKPQLSLVPAGSIILNGYLGGVTLFTLIRLKSEGEWSQYKVIPPFLRLSCLLYFFVALQNSILPFYVSPIIHSKIGILTAGFISFLWGAVTLFYLMQEQFRSGADLKEISSEGFASHYGLTPREKDVLILLLQGKSHKEIGELLFVSARTVDAHVYNIYRKGGVKNKVDLMRAAAALSRE